MRRNESMRRKVSYLTSILLLICIMPYVQASTNEMVFVDNGKAISIHQKGEQWEPGNGYMECSGTHNYLYANREIGPGDFHIRARISLQQLDRTSSSFLLGEHSFGFDDATDKRLWFKRGGAIAKFLAPASKYIKPGKAFNFEVIRKGKTLTFLIDGTKVHSVPFSGEAIGKIGLRPWRSTMRIYQFTADGTFLPPADLFADKIIVGGMEIVPRDPPKGLKTIGGNLLLTVNECMHVQQISHTRSYETRATITPAGDYLYMGVQGRHYGPPGGAYGEKLNKMVAYRSSDKGQTWNGPTLPWDIPYALHGFIPLIPKGSNRMYCFGTEPHPNEREGRENCAIAYRYSDDDGRTWSKPTFIRPVNDPDYKGMSVMRMCETDAGTWLLGTHTGDWTKGYQGLKTRTYVLRSEDQGKTWTLLPGKRPNGWYVEGFNRMDEPRPINLGNGKVMILARTPEGHLWQIYSEDDGKTWSDPRATPLVHPDAPPMIFHLSDGKTLIAFHHNRYNPNQVQHNNRWARLELWYSISKDEGKTWSEPRFVLADAAKRKEGKGRQLSYVDLLVDGKDLHMFLSPNWEGAVHIKFKEEDLWKMPTKAELEVRAAK